MNRNNEINYKFFKMMSKQCTTIKHPCKYCLQSVTRKNGLQCQGACKKWAHFKCLNYTPGKISDIKTGVIKVMCPCPDCESTSPKEIIVDPPFICDNIKCPANKLPMCDSPSCPSKQNLEPPCDRQREEYSESDDNTSQRLNVQPYQPEGCCSDPKQPPLPCRMNQYKIPASLLNSDCSLPQLGNTMEDSLEDCEMEAGFIQQHNSNPCIPPQCPARSCSIGKHSLQKTQLSCPIPTGPCMNPGNKQTGCRQIPISNFRQRNSENSTPLSSDDYDSPVEEMRTLSETQTVEKQSSMAGHIRDMTSTLDKLATQMKSLIEKMDKRNT